MSEYEPLIDDDTGEQVGWRTTATHGALVATDLEGTIIAAVHPETGDELDPSGYAWQQSDEGLEDPYAEQLEQRLADLEQRASEPVEVTYRQDDTIDSDRLTDDLAAQAAQLERLLGRPLLLREKRALAHETLADVEAGDRRPDLFAAAERLEDTDQRLRLDTGKDHEARVALIVGTLADQERQENAAVYGGDDDLTSDVPPPSRDWYDRDSRDEMLTYQTERVEGRAVGPEHLYSSSDIPPEGGDPDA